jgi:rRNA maturation protein Nop10
MGYGKTKSRERNHTILTSFSVIWSCAENSKRLNEWYRINIYNPSKFSLTNRFSKQLRNTIQKLFKDLWTKWRYENKKDETLSPNNFFKSSFWNKKLLKDFTKKYMYEVQKDINQLLI